MEGQVSMKRYESAQASLKEVADRLEVAMQMIAVFQAEKRQWEMEKIKQNDIIARQLGNSDDIVSQLQEEIRSIKSKLCKECYKKVR